MIIIQLMNYMRYFLTYLTIKFAQVKEIERLHPKICFGIMKK